MQPPGIGFPLQTDLLKSASRGRADISLIRRSAVPEDSRAIVAWYGYASRVVTKEERMPLQSTNSEQKARRRRGLSRRTLFAVAGATGAAGLAVRPSAAVTSPKRSKPRAGYRETEHVRTVYRLARF